MNLRVRHLLLLALLLGASAALYLPWRDNPLVFDDAHLIASPTLMDFALRPFSLMTRQFPYFTLGFEHVLSNGDLHVSRYVSLVLHGFNGFVLFLLGQRLLARVLTPSRAFIAAGAMALVFVLHPVAVYAAGYLIQRTVLFATLFLLLSAWQFDKALVTQSWRHAALSGLFYGLSIFSKEHALTGMVGVLALGLLHRPFNWRKQVPVLAPFLAIALPCALWVMSIKFGLVGLAYEPDARELIGSTGFPDQGSRWGNWALSAALQCEYFFRYLGLWLWPDPAGMSIDIRPDITVLTQFPGVLVGPLAFAVFAGGVGWLLSSKKTSASIQLAAYGLVWAMGLYLVELSSVRFQEPVVLYRSYLWAPGFLLAVVAVVSTMPARLAGVLAVGVALALPPLAWGRLATFSSQLALWEEAALKLPQATSPGATRIHFNRGTYRFQAQQTSAALEDFEWVIRQDPQLFQGYWGRSMVRWAQKNEKGALEDVKTVIRMQPGFGPAYERLGLMYKKLGQLEASEAAFAAAQAHGMLRIQFN